MTSTSVKDVGIVGMTFPVASVSPANAGNGKTTEAASFQDIWSSQTDQRNGSETAAPEDGQAADIAEKPRRGESLQNRGMQDTGRKVTPAKEVSAEDEEVPLVDLQTLEEIMAVLGTEAVQLMQEIADTFGMSMEELEQLMSDMNMENIDVFDGNKLGELLLEAGGAQDSLALLTDEGLCNDFRTLMNSRKELLQKVSEEVQIPLEQLEQLVTEREEKPADDIALLSTDAVEPEVRPVVMVETEESQETQEPQEPQAPQVPKEPQQTQEPQPTQELQEIRQDTPDVTVERTDAVTETVVAKPVIKEQSAENDRKQQEEPHKENQGSEYVLQNLQSDRLSPKVQQAAAPPPQWNESTQNIMNQIMDYMRVQLKSDTSSLEMQLHPASLGTLQVNVASKGGVLTANFVTQNEAVKAVLDSQMIQLKESFAQQGVKVEAIEVTVQTHQFESNLEQGRGRQPEDTDKKNRPRRINLNALSDAENEQEMTSEEQIAAAIMTANGNTVDYTA